MFPGSPHPDSLGTIWPAGCHVCSVDRPGKVTGKNRPGRERAPHRSHLGEEVNAVGDGVHGHGVAPDEEAPEVHSVQAVELRVEAGKLPDVIADHVQQALGHIFF